MIETKFCPKCKQELLRDAYTASSWKEPRQPCRVCKSAINRVAYQESVDDGRAQSKIDQVTQVYHAKRFGLKRRADYIAQQQGYVCACCQKSSIRDRAGRNVQPVWSKRHAAKGLKHLQAIVCYPCYRSYVCVVKNIRQPIKMAEFLNALFN